MHSDFFLSYKIKIDAGRHSQTSIDQFFLLAGVTQITKEYYFIAMFRAKVQHQKIKL